MRSILYIVILMFSVSLFAQSDQAENRGPKQPINLIHADSLIGTTIGQTTIYELDGHVHLEQGNVTVYCDHATHYPTENKAECIGNVRIVQGTVTMFMPRGVYYGDLDIARGEGGVRIVDRRSTLTAETGIYSTKSNIATFVKQVMVEDDSVKITADSIIYFRTSEESFAYGNVLMKSKFQNAFIVGDSARNLPKVSYSVIRGRPVLIEVDTVYTNDSNSVAPMIVTTDTTSKVAPTRTDTKKKQQPSKPTKTKSTDKKPAKNSSVVSKDAKDTVAKDTIVTEKKRSFRLDTLSITGNVIESFRANGSKRFVTTGDVEIVRKTIQAKAGKCIYDDEQELITLREKPNIWADSLQLYADSIVIKAPERKLRNIDAYYSSIMILGNDTINLTRKNQITGDEIHILIDKDTIRGVRSLGNAKSLYFMSNENQPDGASRTTCDSLNIVFDQGDLEKIIWLGGINSEFFPENLVGNGTEKFYLPLYKWSESKPSIPLKIKTLGKVTPKADEIKPKTDNNKADTDNTKSEGSTIAPFIDVQNNPK